MQVEAMYLSASNERSSHCKFLRPLQGNAGSGKFVLPTIIIAHLHGHNKTPS